MLTLRTLVDELGLELLRRRERRRRRPMRWVHITELPDPDAVAVGRRAAPDHRHSAERAPSASASSSGGSPDHELAGLGFGTGLHPRARSRGARGGGRASSASRCSRCPTSCRSSRSPRRRSRGSSTSTTTSSSGASRSTSGSSGWCSRSAVSTSSFARWPARSAARSLVLDARGEIWPRRASPDRLGQGRRGARARPRSPHARRAARRAPATAGSSRTTPTWPAARSRCPCSRARARRAAGVAGRLSATPARLGDFERLILQQAVTVVALELMRQRVMRDTERRLAGDVLAEVARRASSASDELAARLRPVRRRRQSAAVLVFALPDPEAGRGRRSSGICATPASARWSRPARGLLCAVVDAGDGVDPVELAAERAGRAGERRARRGHAPPPAGRRRSSALRRSFHEARYALEVAAVATTAHAATSPPGATSAPSSCCSRCRTTRRCASTATACWGRSRTARASTAASCCVRWRRSSSTTASGRAPRASCSATATRCATGSGASSS